MYVHDIMSKNVVTISPKTHIIEAKRIMEEHSFRRLPVVQDGKLVGLIAANTLEKVATPDSGSRGGIWDVAFGLGSLYRTPVSQVMHRNVVTVTPDMTAEEALALAQAKKVGALVVVDDDNKVVGIVTTNDFFYRIVNKVLGIGEPGCRIEVTGGGESEALEEVVSTINKLKLKLVTLHLFSTPRKAKKDVVVHIACDDVGLEKFKKELKAKGYKVDLRKR